MSPRVNPAFVEDLQSDSEIHRRTAVDIFAREMNGSVVYYGSSKDSDSDEDKDEKYERQRSSGAIKESHEFPFLSMGKQSGAHYTISRDCTAGREAHCTALLAGLATRNLRQSSLRHEDLKTPQTQGISLRHNFGPIQGTLGIEADTRDLIDEWERYFQGREKAEERMPIVDMYQVSDFDYNFDFFDLNNAQKSSSRGYSSHQDNVKDGNTARERDLLDGVGWYPLRRSHHRQADIDQMSHPLMKDRRQTEGRIDHVDIEVSTQRMMLRPKVEGASVKDHLPKFNKQSSVL
ncbi:hypothetical protein V2G26_002924 [Clonostachys chloroleuca]